ncbi:MAG TPA: fibronectin type III domain-containing protein [Acidobacteriota bacterium]|nr:fibronectin type III domain-containing protein [Acidobacteriota bacterium]
MAFRRSEETLTSCVRILGFTIFGFLVVTSPAVAGSHTITSLPYTVTEAGTNYSETLYVAGTHLSSATDGIQFGNSAHDVVLYLGTDTISFGTGNGDGHYGIRFFGDGVSGAYNIKIIGGTLLHNPSDTTVSGNVCLFSGGGRDIYIENLDATVKGYNGHVVRAPSSAYKTYNVEINGGTWRSDVTAFNSRCQYDGAVLIVGVGSLSDAGHDYHWKIHDVTVANCPAQGFCISGKSYIYNCTLTVDARNDFYTYPSGGVCYSAANSFTILASRMWAGTEIYNNLLLAGTNYAGADGGILLETCLGTATDSIKVYGNRIDVHRGWDAYYGHMNPKGIKMRYHNRYVHIFDNDITITVGDTANPNNTAYGPNGIGLEVVTYPDQGCDWATGADADSNCVWENNYVEVRALDAEFSGTHPGLGASCVRVALKDDQGYTWTGAGNHFRYNHLKGCENIYKIAGYDAQGKCEQMFIYEDTIEFDETDYAGIGKYVFYVGYDLEAQGNIARDLWFVGRAGDSVRANGSIRMHTGGDAGERDLAIERTLRIYVQGNNDSLVSNAAVWAVNAYGDTAFVTSTGSTGGATGTARYWQEFRYAADSMQYNDYTLGAARGSDTTTIPFTVSWNQYVSTLTLSNTAGDTEWGDTSLVDTEPPSPVRDLSAVPGPELGSTRLTWTATGDDGSSGTATYYAIKYATTPIDAYNWYFARNFSTPPTPATGGQPDSCIVDGLVPGQFYYFAVKAFDEMGNASAIADTSGFSRGILAPVTSMDTIIADTIAGEATLFAGTVPSYLTLIYEFILDTDTFFTGADTVTVVSYDELAQATFSGLSNSLVYYYRCRAIADDSSEYSPWSLARGFNLVTGFINLPPTVPTIDSPLPGEIVTSLTPTLYVQNSADPEGDSLTYEFRLYNEDGTVLLASATDIPEDLDVTGWTVPEGILQRGQPYGWQVRSRDDSLYSSWMPFALFSVLILGAESQAQNLVVYAYPNPVSFSQGGHVTFVLPVEPVELVIKSVSGGTVLARSGLSGNWMWDGRNAEGYEVATGIYLWYVAGRDRKGKLMVVP